MTTLYVSDYGNEVFETASECKAFEKKYTDMFKSVMFYNGKKRINCKTAEDCENAFNECTRLKFPNEEIKKRYCEYFGLAAYIDNSYGGYTDDVKDSPYLNYVYNENLNAMVVDRK